MVRTVMLVVALALAGLCAWLMLRSEAAGSIAGETVSAAATSASRASMASESATETPTSRASLSRSEVTASAPSIPPDARWIDVLIVDKASGEPVPAATVMWSDPSTYQRMPVAEQSVWLGRDEERIAREYGWRTASDERGMARVHLPDPWVQVHVRKNGLYGYATASKAAPPPSPLRIEISEDRTLLAKVVDAAGQPAAGVPVAIALHGADGAFLRLLSGGASMYSMAPDGLARARHLQEWRDRAWGNLAQASAKEWRVRIHLPGVSDSGVAFDPAAPPAEPIVLRLPPTCSVTARVEYAGRIVPNARSVALSGPKATGSTPNDSQNEWQVRIDDDGRARFPFVPLDGTLTLVAYLTPGSLKKELVGPRVASQEIEVVLDVPRDNVVLVGRVLGPDRVPLGKRMDLELEFRTNSGGGTAMVPIDADGRFQFFLGALREGARLQQFVFSVRYVDRPALRASVGDRELQAGVQDLGDLVLEPGPLVVAGRLVQGNEPYAGQVTLWIERAQEARGRSQQISWEQVRDLTIGQFAGKFDVRGEAPAGRYRLVFPARDHLPIAPIEFALGTKDLVVQVERGVQLAASLLMPPDMPWGVRAVLEPRDANVPREREDSTSSSGYDRFAAEPHEQAPGRYVLNWQAVRRGTYTLVVRLWAQQDRLLSIPNLELPLRDDDRRLQDIDLRGKVEVLTLRIVGPDGAPLAYNAAVAHRETLVFPMPQDMAAAEWFGYPAPRSGARLPVPPRPVDLLVTTDGRYRPAEVRAARTEAEVRLEPWPSTELVFVGLDELALPKGYTLGAWASKTGQDAPSRYVTQGSSGGLASVFSPRQESGKVEGGRKRIELGTGPHRLSVYLLQAGGRSRRLGGVTPAEIEPSTVPIAVHVPRESLQSALAELQAPSEGKK